MPGRLVFEDSTDLQILYFPLSLCIHLFVQVQAHACYSLPMKVRERFHALALSLHAETGSLVCYSIHQASGLGSSGILLSFISL